MLNVYFKESEIKDMEIIRNPVAVFDTLELKQTEIVDILLEKIEKAKYLSPSHFLSRYNEKIPIDFMSTGTKVAIVATTIHDKVIDLRECGVNARDAIFNYVDNAHVLAYSTGYGIISEDEATNKEFFCNGYKFIGIRQFADYVYRDYPGEPNSCLEV